MPMVTPPPSSAGFKHAAADGDGSAASTTSRSYVVALAAIAALFFMWGFLTCLNDILVPHLKAIFDLDYARAMLIQMAFFGAYFVFAIPASTLIDWLGYQRAIVLGLLVVAAGAFLFVPAASVPSFPLFLLALIVLAAGMTGLQVAANPYVTALGRPQTASSRLSLTGAFNSLGTFLAPLFGEMFILSAAPKSSSELHALTPEALQAFRLHDAATVKGPYIGLGLALVMLAVIFSRLKLPQIEQARHPVSEHPNDSLWKHPNLIFGAIGIFVYVGAEVAIGSFSVNYFSQPDIGGLTEKDAADFVAFYWGGAMVGRFLGSALLQKVSSRRVLGISAICAMTLIAVSMLSHGPLAMWSMIAVGLFNSTMFPSIFTLGVAGLGPLLGDASGIMIMAIVGGALVPEAQGLIADAIGIHHAFFVPIICYLYIAFFAWHGSKSNSERHAGAANERGARAT